MYWGGTFLGRSDCGKVVLGCGGLWTTCGVVMTEWCLYFGSVVVDC